MKFEEALAIMKTGHKHKLKRSVWRDDCFIFIKDNKMYDGNDGKIYECRITPDEMLKDDWEMVK